MVLVGWLALAASALAGETAEELWPETDAWIQHDSHPAVSKLLALDAILNLYF